MRVRALSVAVALAAVLAPSAARADDKECMSAAAKGQEVRDEGKLVEAKTLFETCADSACPGPIPGYCAQWLADVKKKIPTIVLRAAGEDGRDIADATAQIDGRASVAVDGRPVEIDPGRHTLRVSHDGHRPFEDVVVVAQGEKDRVVVATLKAAAPVAATAETPAPPAAAAPKRVPTASWVAWGIGAGALLTFTAFALKARIDYDDLESRCGNRCTLSDRDDVATTVTVADVSLVIGLVAAGVGTVFYLAQPHPKTEARR